MTESLLRCEIAYNQYGGYCVPRSCHHRHAVQAILAGEVYEPDTISYMQDLCGDGDIVHAGTFFGDFLPALSTACGPDQTIWAFEPNRESYRCAIITIALNDLTNVRLTNAGLSDRDAALSLEVIDSKGQKLGGGSRFVGENQTPGDRTINARALCLDDIVPEDRDVNLIQLDVEGFEQFALIGALKTIRRCKPVLILETLPELSWISDNLATLGYKMLDRIHDNYVLSIT